jgi:hypothetical protein
MFQCYYCEFLLQFGLLVEVGFEAIDIAFEFTEATDFGVGLAQGI